MGNEERRAGKWHGSREGIRAPHPPSVLFSSLFLLAWALCFVVLKSRMFLYNKVDYGIFVYNFSFLIPPDSTLVRAPVLPTVSGSPSQTAHNPEDGPVKDLDSGVTDDGLFSDASEVEDESENENEDNETVPPFIEEVSPSDLAKWDRGSDA